METSYKVVLLGAGNLATHLALALFDNQLPVMQIYSHTLASAKLLKEKLQQDIAITSNLKDILPDADVYICSLKDDALLSVLREIPSFGHGIWLHTSGSLPMTIFEEYTDRYGVLYPLQTFSRNRELSFNEIPICIESSFAQDMPLLHQFAAAISNRVYEMDSQKRMVLHLAGVFANNFTTNMYAIASELLAREGIDFSLLLPIIDETAQKVHSLSPADAQTGPAKRKDVNIIGQHLKLLEDQGMTQYAELYRQLTHTICERYDSGTDSILFSMNISGHEWRFGKVGGKPCVLIESGQDLVHLHELDRKMWTVLSCPVQGLGFDAETLRLIDTDCDGIIHIDEVKQATKWETSVLKDPDMLLRQEDEMPLSALDTDKPEGKRLYTSAQQILEHLGLKKNTISIADIDNEKAAIAKTGLNGDGVITTLSTNDRTLKQTIEACIATIGPVQDCSGLAGADEKSINAFYKTCSDYSTWQDACTSEVLPFGPDTEKAHSSWLEVRDRIDDYFKHMRQAVFDSDSTNAPGINKPRILSLTQKVDPVWQEAFDVFKKHVFPNCTEIDESQWNSLRYKFSAYEAWTAAKVGTEAEPLGLSTINNILEQDRRMELLQLIADDQAMGIRIQNVEAVNRLVHYYRYLYDFVKNYVTLTDFYNPQIKAIFQAGTLYIGQCSCDLCIKVTDITANDSSVRLSGMYLIYCECTRRHSLRNDNSEDGNMTIVAVLTKGNVSKIRVGMNAIFHDREGLDWDAVVTRIVENPISVKGAFLSPYRKSARFCSRLMHKLSGSGDKNMAKSYGQSNIRQAFDVGKFLILFAVLGMVLGIVCGSYLDRFTTLEWWEMLIILAATGLLISVISLFAVWLKLRKRDLAPLLNANGWALNTSALVSTAFGSKLTDTVSSPSSKPIDQSQKGKKAKPWIITVCIILALVAAFAALYLTNILACIGLPFNH